MLLTALLAGCESNPDPASGGFFSGVQGLSSGTYEQRLQEREQTLEAEQAAQQRLSAEADALDAEQAAVSDEIAQSEMRLATLDRETQALEREIASAAQAERISAAERTRLEAEVRDLKLAQDLVRRDPVIDVAAKQRRIAQLEERQRSLEATLAAALE
ncbi:MAG: hypothetical protein AAF675_21545 [Pseudomonadota bacterium]